MIHPDMQNPFGIRQAELFRWISQRTDGISEIAEFVRWHMEANETAVCEVSRAMRTDLDDKASAKEWATEFLERYDAEIRRLRDTSNRAFARFQNLKRGVFGDLAKKYPEKGDDMSGMMRLFVSGSGPLIGRIIFAYREPWFLARQVCSPGCGLGSVPGYRRWAGSNLGEMVRMQEGLRGIHDILTDAERQINLRGARDT